MFVRRRDSRLRRQIGGPNQGKPGRADANDWRLNDSVLQDAIPGELRQSTSTHTHTHADAQLRHRRRPVRLAQNRRVYYLRR